MWMLPYKRIKKGVNYSKAEEIKDKNLFKEIWYILFLIKHTKHNMCQQSDGTLRNHFKKRGEKKLFSFFVFTTLCKFN